MAIATLIFATLILKLTGTSGISGMTGAIAIGSIICIVAAIAGDCSQDLKTGFILGATPRKQQIGEFIGVAAAAAAIGSVLYLLGEAWGYGSEQIPAPQATMMKMLVEGIMDARLPWALIFTGAGIAVAIEFLKIPVLPVAVGMYLPFSLSAGIMAGGIFRWLTERKKEEKAEKKERTERGILYTSGLIAGEGLMGVILALLAVFKLDHYINVSGRLSLGPAGAVILFGLLLGSLAWVCFHKGKPKITI